MNLAKRMQRVTRKNYFISSVNLRSIAMLNLGQQILSSNNLIVEGTAEEQVQAFLFHQSEAI
jgi:hypothetical protein